MQKNNTWNAIKDRYLKISILVDWTKNSKMIRELSVSLPTLPKLINERSPSLGSYSFFNLVPKGRSLMYPEPGYSSSNFPRYQSPPIQSLRTQNSAGLQVSRRALQSHRVASNLYPGATQIDK